MGSSRGRLLAGVKFVAATLLAWCGVLVAGRLTAYLGSLYTG
jgi:hypothetical protein